MTDAKLTTDALLDAIFEAFRMHSSPTVDYGDSHGERGQGGMIIWKSSHPFIRAAVTAALADYLDGLRKAGEADLVSTIFREQWREVELAADAAKAKR